MRELCSYDAEDLLLPSCLVLLQLLHHNNSVTLHVFGFGIELEKYFRRK